MMQPYPAIISVEVSARSMWQCRVCDKVRAGDRISAVFDYTPEPRDLLQHQRVCHIPVGWASYGTAGVECPDHLKE